jgi:hypothetical protein
MSFVERWTARLAKAFVTEAVADDGTRMVFALDPSCQYGMGTLLVSTEPVDWIVPDDLRELI